MSLRIQNNVEAFNAHRNLGNTEGALARSMERLSSGYRINRAADDAAGLAISERLRGQIRGLDQSQRNVSDAVRKRVAQRDRRDGDRLAVLGADLERDRLRGVQQAEQPPGSNDSPRIAMYRQATAGAPGPGPWCAYFVSWACKQAGVPLMDGGAGSGSVDAIYAWAQRTGRAQPSSSSYTPRPGDLIVFNEHIGIVENVLPDGRIQTIEGNSSDRVSRRTHARSEAVGFVCTG